MDADDKMGIAREVDADGTVSVTVSLKLREEFSIGFQPENRTGIQR